VSGLSLGLCWQCFVISGWKLSVWVGFKFIAQKLKSHMEA
jgi:hypothetical protein